MPGCKYSQVPGVVLSQIDGYPDNLSGLPDGKVSQYPGTPGVHGHHQFP